MNEKEKLYDTLLQLGTALREKRAHVYGVGWELHKEKVEAVCEADKQYMDLPLTEEQKEVIERMLEKRMEANECELTLTYIAGILDGISYLRAVGFLDMYVVDSEELSKKTDKKDKRSCFAVAIIPGRDGCLAAKTRHGKELVDFAGKWTEKGIEIYVISRPEAYGEYGPYTFLVSLGMLDGALEAIWKEKGMGSNGRLTV